MGTRKRGRRLLALAILAAAVGLVTASTNGNAGPTPTPPPPPVDWSQVPPGQQTLIAVLPSGSSQWIDVQNMTSSDRSAYLSSTPGTVTVSRDTTVSGASATTAPAVATYSYGCDANVTTPFFSGNDLLGRVAWSACFNVSEVDDNVGLQKYGNTAGHWNLTVKYGGANFTALSAPKTDCVFVKHQFRTVDTATITSDEFDTSYWAGSSVYSDYYC
jgi:hypothetical protein